MELLDLLARAQQPEGAQLRLHLDRAEPRGTRDLEFGGVLVPAAHVHAAFMAALGFAYATIVSTGDHLAATEEKSSAA